MGDSAREKSRALFVFALPSCCYAMTEHDSPTSIMNEKPLSPAARAGLVVNAAFTILLFYLTAILFMAGFGGVRPPFPRVARAAGPRSSAPVRRRPVAAAGVLVGGRGGRAGGPAADAHRPRR